MFSRLIHWTNSAVVLHVGAKSFVIMLKSFVNTSSVLYVMTTVPCPNVSVVGRIRLMTAVVGFGETGKIFSPKSAFEKDDLPALNAPKSATVRERCSIFAFIRRNESIMDSKSSKSLISLKIGRAHV